MVPFRLCFRPEDHDSRYGLMFASDWHKVTCKVAGRGRKHRLMDVRRIAAGRGDIDHARQRARARGAACHGLRASKCPATNQRARIQVQAWDTLAQATVKLSVVQHQEHGVKRLCTRG